jgi:hypothetical protein
LFLPPTPPKQLEKKTDAPSHRRQSMPHMDVSPFRRRLYGIRKGWHVPLPRLPFSRPGEGATNETRRVPHLGFDQCTDSVNAPKPHTLRRTSTFFSPPALSQRLPQHLILVANLHCHPTLIDCSLSLLIYPIKHTLDVRHQAHTVPSLTVLLVALHFLSEKRSRVTYRIDHP